MHRVSDPFRIVSRDGLGLCDEIWEKRDAGANAFSPMQVFLFQVQAGGDGDSGLLALPPHGPDGAESQVTDVAYELVSIQNVDAPLPR